MRTIDLHVHSTASDGTMTPEELVEYAIKKGLYAFALTDHDTVAGIDAALLAAGDRIKVIPGIEMAVSRGEKEIHILGLGIDHKNSGFLKTVADDARRRDVRNRRIIRLMNEAGIPVREEELLSGAMDGETSITKSHFAVYLVKHGYAADKKEAFLRLLGRNCPFYAPFERKKPEEAVAAITAAGGRAVLAHPFLYGYDREGVDALAADMKAAGVSGIECIYSCNEGDDEAYARSLAEKYGLFITGGSDFHGKNKPDIDLGSGKGNLSIPADILGGIFDGRI